MWVAEGMELDSMDVKQGRTVLDDGNHAIQVLHLEGTTGWDWFIIDRVTS